jgi:hypothetical protein
MPPEVGAFFILCGCYRLKILRINIHFSPGFAVGRAC